MTDLKTKTINYDYLNCYNSLLAEREDLSEGGGTCVFAVNFVSSQRPMTEGKPTLTQGFHSF